MSKQYKLCYVWENVMYFTDNFANQWGDDWNDRPYEYNSEPPYEQVEEWTEEQNIERGRGNIRCIAFMPKFDIRQPRSGYLNSPFSVEDINNGAVPWLYNEKAGALMAGATMGKAKKWLKDIGIMWAELHD